MTPQQRTAITSVIATLERDGDEHGVVSGLRQALGASERAARPLTAPVTDDEIDATYQCIDMHGGYICGEEMRRALEGFAAGRAAKPVADKGVRRSAGSVMMSAYALCPTNMSHPARMAWIADYFLSHAAGVEPAVVEPTLANAYAIGQTGAPHNEAEHALFREYLRGHCWRDGMWSDEKKEYIDQGTRMFYAVWRARAALKPAATKGAL